MKELWLPLRAYFLVWWLSYTYVRSFSVFVELLVPQNTFEGWIPGFPEPIRWWDSAKVMFLLKSRPRWCVLCTVGHHHGSKGCFRSQMFCYLILVRRWCYTPSPASIKFPVLAICLEAKLLWKNASMQLGQPLFLVVPKRWGHGTNRDATRCNPTNFGDFLNFILPFLPYSHLSFRDIKLFLQNICR